MHRISDECSVMTVKQKGTKGVKKNSRSLNILILPSNQPCVKNEGYRRKSE